MDDGEESGESWVRINLLRIYMTGARGLIYLFIYCFRPQSKFPVQQGTLNYDGESKLFQLYDLFKKN